MGLTKIQSVIRPVSGGDGPFWVVSSKDGVDFNVTLTVANLSAALDQAKTDQASVVSGVTVMQITIATQGTT